jgi:hypothetical protein
VLFGMKLKIDYTRKKPYWSFFAPEMPLNVELSGQRV